MTSIAPLYCQRHSVDGQNDNSIDSCYTCAPRELGYHREEYRRSLQSTLCLIIIIIIIVIVVVIIIIIIIIVIISIVVVVIVVIIIIVIIIIVVIIIIISDTSHLAEMGTNK